MAFCEKCGKELGPDGVCDCQKTQAAEAPKTAEASGADAAPKTLQDTLKDMLKDKKIVTIAAAAVAAVVLLIIIAAVAGSGSYKTPVKELVKLINKQSTDVFAYKELEDPIQADYLRDAYSILKKNKDYKEGFEEKREDIAELYEDIKGFKITSCDFVKAEPMKSKELRAIKGDQFDSDLYEAMIEEIDDMDKGDYEDLAEGLDISVSDAKKFAKKTVTYLKALGKADVSKGYVVTLRFYGKFEDEDDKTEKIEEIQIIKVNGKWCIYDMGNLFRKIKFSDELSDVNLYSIYRTIGSVNFGL